MNRSELINQLIKGNVTNSPSSMVVTRFGLEPSEANSSIRETLTPLPKTQNPGPKEEEKEEEEE